MSKNISIAATAIFVKGANYQSAESIAAETMRTTDPEKQKQAKLELKAGIMAILLKPKAKPDAKLAAFISKVMSTPGKDRKPEWVQADSTARTQISRLLAGAVPPIENLDKRGGAENAGKGTTKGPKEKPATGSGKAEDGEVPIAGSEPAPKSPIPMAAYVSPTIKAPVDLAEHFAFVAKELGAVLKKAEPVMNPKQLKAYRKAVANFTAEIKALASLK